MIHRTWAMMRKEFIQILRDPRTLSVMFLIPVMQLVLMGYAATNDVDNLPTAVLDYDRSARSRELLNVYQASGYFNLSYYVASEDDLATLIDSGRARAGLIIPAGYGHDLVQGKRVQIKFVIDGSDPTVANTAFSAAQSVGQAYSVDILRQTMGADPLSQPGLDVRPRVWYNPDMKSVNFMIPGIMSTVLQLVTMMLTAQAIVREREQGTIEQLIVTPIRPIELIIGKVAPYVVVSLFNLAEILLIGVFWFEVPIHGSVTLLVSLASFSLLTSLGLGLFISTVAKSQQEASLLTYFTVMPSIFLSGFFFPIEAMPVALQWISYLVPLRYLLVIIRSIILKGVGLDLLIDQVVALAIFGIVLLALSALRFRKKLE